MNRILTIGDIHGNFKALKQALERSSFDYENDTLISLGDVVDGYSQSYECVEELLKIKNLIAIRGNHDEWWINWLQSGIHSPQWGQGGEATLISYAKNILGEDSEGFNYTVYPKRPLISSQMIPKAHIDFFINQIPYHINNNKLFVHGGFDRHYYITDKIHNSNDFLMWDRDLWHSALSYENMGYEKEMDKPSFRMEEKFDEIFIGHTATRNWGENKPMKAANIWNLDQGAGWYGYLTIMDVETKEYWQSDKATELYPDYKFK